MDFNVDTDSREAVAADHSKGRSAPMNQHINFVEENLRDVAIEIIQRRRQRMTAHIHLPLSVSSMEITVSIQYWTLCPEKSQFHLATDT